MTPAAPIAAAKPFPVAVAAAGALLLAWRWRRLGWEGRALALVAIAAFAIYGSGLVVLPSLEDAIRRIGTTLGQWTYLLVGVMAFLETGAFVGLVAPGETIVTLGGVVAGQGEIEIVPLIALVWACAVLGDLASYLAGRRFGREALLRHGPRVKITPGRLEQVEGFFARYGGATILVGRFIGLVRALAPFVAGTSRLPMRRFLPYDVVGAGLWAATFCLLGYVFWKSFDRVLAIAKQGLLAFGVVVGLIVGGVAAARWLRVPQNRRRADRWLDARERAALVGPVVRAARMLVDRAVLPAARRVRPAARFVRDRLTPGELGLELTTLLAVGLVGGFGFVLIGNAILAGRVPPLDPQAQDLARSMRPAAVVDLAKAASFLGTGWVFVPVVLAACAWAVGRGRPLEAGALAIGTVLLSIASPIAKAAYDRPRPAGGLVEAAGSSYPSGHALHATAYVAVAVVLARVAPRLGGRVVVVGAGVAVAASIGLSRVVLGVHWLSDVLGGWGLGAAILCACGCVALVIGFVRQNAPEPR